MNATPHRAQRRSGAFRNKMRSFLTAIGVVIGVAR